VTDGYGSLSTATFTVTVIDVPLQFTPPVPTLGPVTTGNFWINTSWQSGIGYDTNSYNVSKNNDWTNGSLTSPINSTYSAHGWQNLTIYAWNSSGTGTLSTTSLINNTQIPNNIPVLAPIGNKEITAGQLLSFTLSATDADSDPLTNASNYSKGTFTPSTGVYTWTPTSSDVGTYQWEFNTSDSYGGIDSETITITVSSVSTYLPPTPVNIASTTGNFYVNTTWQAGSGNATTSYRVNVNGAWTNGSANTFAYSTLSAHAWQNVSVYAFNSEYRNTE